MIKVLAPIHNNVAFKNNKSEDENRADLAKQAYDSMVKYSKKNTYEYFEYKKK